jgi:flagellar motor switch protein FliN/FliY
MQFDVADIQQKVAQSDTDYIVAVRFMLQIEGLLNSEFMTVLPVDFTRELVDSAMNMGEAEQPAPPPLPAPKPAPAPSKPAPPPGRRPRRSKDSR